MTKTLRPMDVAGRVGRLIERFDAAGIDALLVTNLTNVRYLTGFTGSSAFLAVTPDGMTFVTDGRYTTQSAEQLAAAGVDADIEIAGTDGARRDALGARIGSRLRVGLEARSVTWHDQRRYAADWFSEAELIPTVDVIEELRRIKDEGELDRMAAAAEVADRALVEVLGMLVDGRTEAEIALELDSTMKRFGAQGPSFETIVAGGPNGAKPHHRPSDRPIAPGELVVMDFGAIVDGYCSDMTRTFCVGDPGDETRARMLDVVTASQAAGVAAIRSGADVSAVDLACRQVIDDAGWGDAFIHATGHGVGLDVHEDPRVSQVASGTLAAGHVVTVEPGVYLPGVGGVRVEDTVVVTDDGCRPLTLSPKEPILR